MAENFAARSVGASDAAIRFQDMRSLLMQLGFDERVRGAHHIFTKAGIAEILNLQPRGSMSQPHQVKQVREVVLKYRLAGNDDEGSGSQR